MKLMKTVLKYGAVFGAGIVCTILASGYGAVYNDRNPGPNDQVLILDDCNGKHYRVVAITNTDKHSLSLATIRRIV